ncbi:CDP-alcohol phosphatidyltransferase family protein [Rhizobium sp. TRM95111]|uniref:CDP-alcohol phosphatidyltransferase family protein n=1 Tax=Rhizobium alarense TaxID=2846851 RepID=UPI001F2F0A23|nr:CDP-alcohol phosphatidyltransferase family protein [Rhizobium alarense]MCF3641974.1 CDP-alcohol phosphatidyltransferase family protein [Rhizobium alarense]
MLDGLVRRAIDPLLDRTGRRLAAGGIGADAVTLAGLALGLGAAGLVAAGHSLAALGLLLASRLCDGLDGAVARHSRRTDFGGFLDIVLDFAFYGAVPFGFVLADPAGNAVPGAFLILSFYVNGASFLAYSIMAEKRGLATQARGAKSLYFTTGLAEATETLAVFVAACLVPAAFPWLAWGFAAVCFYTALSRILLARRMFRDDAG